MFAHTLILQPIYSWQKILAKPIPLRVPPSRLRALWRFRACSAMCLLVKGTPKRGFYMSASRRTRALEPLGKRVPKNPYLVFVSVPFWGPPLPWPLQIIGFVSRYLTNYLICRSPILRRTRSNSRSFWVIQPSSIDDLSWVSLTFARLSTSLGQVESAIFCPLSNRTYLRVTQPYAARTSVRANLHGLIEL